MKKNLLNEKQSTERRHYAMGYWFVVIVACLLVVIFASNSPLVDYLSVKYSAINRAISSVTDEDGEIDTAKVQSVLNKGVAAPTANGETTYISDLIMASDYYSADVAKNTLKNAGYLVIDQNMNDGTGEGYVYLGYKTTTDKSLAITDISIMNMKGDYRLMDYADVASDKEDNLNSLVDEFRNMLMEYRFYHDHPATGYSATAELARLGLNKIAYGKTKTSPGEPLGDLLLAGHYDDKFLYDMLLMANSAVVAGIYNYLTFAVQSPKYIFDDKGKVIEDKGGKSWLEKIVYEDLEDEWAVLEAKVASIFPDLEEFSQACQNAIVKSEAYEEESKEENSLPDLDKDEKQIMEEYRDSDMQTAMEQDTESIYLASYLQLQKFPYRDGTLADLFVPRDSDGIFLPIIMEDFAPLVKCISNGQYASIHAGNFVSLLNNSFLNQKAYDDAVEGINKTFDGDTLDLFYGVDKEIFERKVGVTDTAYRQMSASNNYDIATAPDSTVLEQVNMWVGIGTGIIMTVTGSFALISAMGTLFPALFAKFATASAILSFTKLAVVGTVSSILNWACLALIVVVLLTMLGFWIADLVDYYNPKYTPIPSRMYDIQGDRYVGYDAVKDLSLTKAPYNGDLNNFEGLQWNALYVTKDARVADPIMLNSEISGGGAVFNIQRGSNYTPKGYEPVTGFGEKAAFNTNAYAYSDYVGGIYLYHLVDGTLTADKLVPRRKYISSILLRTEKNESAAKYYLTNKGYDVINVNLTPGMYERATFIGIKTTDDPDAALTDLRIAYGTNQDQIIFGDCSYGMCGFSGLEPERIGDNKIGPITNFEYALYSTSDKKRGSAIQSDLMIRHSVDTSNTGAEPINLFSGGGAFDFGVLSQYVSSDLYISPTYVYFTPKVVYTSGVKYLGGIFGIINTLETNDSIDFIKKRFHDKYPGTSIDPVFEKQRNSAFGGSFQNNPTIRYTTTYNPKRAIGDVLMFEQMTTDIQNFVSDRMTAPETLANRGNGYVTCELIKRSLEVWYGIYVSSFQYNKIACGKPLYVMPATDDCPPLVMDKDIKFFSADSFSDIPRGYRNISAQNNYYGTNYNYIYSKYRVWNSTIRKYEEQSKKYVYIITNRPQPVKPKYINTVVPSFSNVEDYAIDYARMGAASLGAEEYVNIMDGIPLPYNLNAEEYPDDMYGLLGITYTKKKTEALRDVAMYYVCGKSAPTAGSTAKTHDMPPSKITRFGIEYTRATNNGIYAGNVNGDKYFYVYFYVSHQTIAGEPISKIYFNNKMMDIAGETSKVLSYGPDSIQGFYYMHIERTKVDKYVTHIATEYENAYGRGDVLYNKATYNWIGEAWIDAPDTAKLYLQMFGCSLYANGNLNHNSYGRVDDYPIQCMLGYDYGPKSMAITDIVARQFQGGDWQAEMAFNQTLLDPLFINGIEYELSSGNVNRNGRPIYLYITRDRKAGSPIQNLVIDYTDYRRDNPSYWDTWEIVKLTPDSGGGRNRNANLNYGAKAYDTSWDNRVFIKYRREDYSVGKGNTSIASVFSDSTTLLVICFAVVISSGVTAAIIYGRSKKRKKSLLNK